MVNGILKKIIFPKKSLSWTSIGFVILVHTYMIKKNLDSLFNPKNWMVHFTLVGVSRVAL